MYTIAEAARRAGVSVPVLRAWERRYRIVQPARTAAGYRLYDEAAIARVRALRRLVDEGWTPSTAAARIRAEGLPAEAVAADGTERPGTAGPVAPAVAGAGSGPLITAFVDAAARLDEAAVGAVLDEMFARGSFERVAGDLLMPALVALGEAWAQGGLSVAAEHLATAAVHRRLSGAFDAAGGDTRLAGGHGRVLVGLPPGARHELGALAFAVIARRAGLSVVYLGPDLPVDDWLRAAGELRADGHARAAVLGVVTRADRAAAKRVIDALRVARPDLVVAVGGRAARHRDGIVRLPDPLPAAVAALGDQLARAP